MRKKAEKTVFLASDHAGFRLKEAIRAWLAGQGRDVRDLGAFSEAPSDYPDFAIPCAKAVARSRGGAVGIIIGGSGNGEAMAANRIRDVRAALVYDAWTARMSREHNDANVLCLGARTPSGRQAAAKRLIGLWLKTAFSREPRHRRRIRKMDGHGSRC